MKLEAVGRLASFGAGHYFLAHGLYGGGGAGIGAFSAVFGGHLRGGLHAQGNFLVSAHVHVLSFAGYLVFRSIEKVAEQRHRRHNEPDDEAQI